MARRAPERDRGAVARLGLRCPFRVKGAASRNRRSRLCFRLRGAARLRASPPTVSPLVVVQSPSDAQRGSAIDLLVSDGLAGAGYGMVGVAATKPEFESTNYRH